MVARNTSVNALVGAVVSVVLAFLPFSPLLGGGVAGFLEGRDGGRIGLLSGVFAAVPLFLLLAVVGGVIAVVPDLTPAVAGGVVVVAAVVVVFLLVYTVGLSALGGMLGAYLARELRGGGSAPAGEFGPHDASGDASGGAGDGDGDGDGDARRASDSGAADS